MVYTILLINGLITILRVVFKDMLEFWRSAEGSLQVCISTQLPPAVESGPDRCSPSPSHIGRNQASSSIEPRKLDGRPSDHILYLEPWDISEKLLLTLRVTPSGIGHEPCQHLAGWSARKFSPSVPHVSYLTTTGQ